VGGDLEDLHPRKFFEWVIDLLMTKNQNMLPVFDIITMAPLSYCISTAVVQPDFFTVMG
jgi:hypothetical protein